MARKSRKQIILAKIESTKGTDSVPTGTNAMLVEDLDVVPLQGDTIERGHVKPYYGAKPMIHVGVHVAITFAVELAGAGAAGDAPKWGPLVRACDFAETLVASTSATYSLVSGTGESVSIYYHRDGHRHAVVGVQGSVALEFNANSYPRLRFTLLGQYVAPATVADPSPSYTGWQSPLECNTANTTFSLHSFAACLASLTIDQRSTVVYRELIGCAGVEVTDRNAGGSLVIDEPALASKDYFAIVKADTLGTLQVVHGTAAGNIVTVSAAGSGGGAQILNPRFSDQDGISQLAADLALVPTSAGNDEFSIVVT